MLGKLRQQKERLLGGDSNPSEEWTEKYCGCKIELSYKERLVGCSIFFFLGFMLSMGSTFRLVKLLHGHPGPFATMYSIGNILSLFSTAFFVGPCKQLQSMFDKKRRISAILYLAFILVTLALCFSPHVPGRVLWVMLSILFQFSSLVWLNLSYIPYGRSVCKACLLRTCGCTSDEVV